jgi:hypothetical protein
LVIKGPQETSPEFLKDFIFSFLIKLKEYDSTNETITKNDILKNNFQFSLDSDIWFPVFLCPEHISTIRRANISIIAFQPNQTLIYSNNTLITFMKKQERLLIIELIKYTISKDPFFCQKRVVESMQYNI